MGLLSRAALLFGGFMVFREWQKARQSPAAFAEGEGAPGNDAQIRNAGPDAMRDPSDEPWTEADEDGDESFPASDPPGNY